MDKKTLGNSQTLTFSALNQKDLTLQTKQRKILIALYAKRNHSLKNNESRTAITFLCLADLLQLKVGKSRRCFPFGPILKKTEPNHFRLKPLGFRDLVRSFEDEPKLKTFTEIFPPLY